MSADKVITIFGSARCAPHDPDYQAAYELGRSIAEAGWVVCNGGYGGTMEAAAKGAVESGGHTIGVTCSALRRRGGPNAYIRQEVPTFDLLTRLNTLVRLANAYIVLPGGTGTLLELALVWELYSKGMLRRVAPIVLLGAHWVPIDGPVRTLQPDARQLPVAPDVPTVVRILHEAFNQQPATPQDVTDEGE